MILLIDNFDSFSHNLARYLRLLGQTVEVVRNDAVDATAVRRMSVGALVLSPGPCGPHQAGCSMDLVHQFSDTMPILGICLGHQVIVEAFGGIVTPSNRPVHGRASRITHDGKGVFVNVPNPMTAARYHALVAVPTYIPAELQVSARTSDGVVMAVRHRRRPIVGLQFHPESILTRHGFALLANFLTLAGLEVQRNHVPNEWPARSETAATWRTSGRPVTF